MGARINIALDYGRPQKVYLYSHWGGEGQAEHKLKLALHRQERWDDPSYLARIIFSELIKDDIEGETGYGLSLEEIDPEYPTIEVDLVAHTITKGGITQTFKEFLK